jgi:dihydropyrimidinase
MENIIIKNGILVGADSSIAGDIALKGGKILEIGNLAVSSFFGYQVIDATGKFVMPGGFDPHVHLALPTPAGDSCDDFLSGSRAALAGGTTFLMDFVTPRRGQSLLEAWQLRSVQAAGCLSGFGLHMGISEWNPQIAREIVPVMEKHGVRSFKAYLAYRETIGIGYDALHELMQIVGRAGGLVMVHCEDGEMVSRLQHQLLLEGKTRACYHPLSRPSEAEIRAIEKVIELSALTNCPVYIVHISTMQGAKMVSTAKKEGLAVFGETCPHYLILDDTVYDSALDDAAVMPYVLSPPIRKKADQQQLWERLSDNTIDVVATDHCPFNLRGQKELGENDFTKIPNGAGGIEHRLSLLYTYGVLTGKITMNQFVSLVSTRPAEIFGFGHRKGKLLPGYDADMVIWDPEYEKTISVANHLQNCDSEIYEGIKIQGYPETVILNAQIVNRKS